MPRFEGCFSLEATSSVAVLYGYSPSPPPEKGGSSKTASLKLRTHGQFKNQMMAVTYNDSPEHYHPPGPFRRSAAFFGSWRKGIIHIMQRLPKVKPKQQVSTRDWLLAALPSTKGNDLIGRQQKQEWKKTPEPWNEQGAAQTSKHTLCQRSPSYPKLPIEMFRYGS